ncbi:MAG TPA: hypothetical protein PLC40_05370 [Candidatus Hydrogenedentes bacterium]|nr:hypothetical protein [Candidatus Hydrogenedentota bacterium]
MHYTPIIRTIKITAPHGACGSLAVPIGWYIPAEHDILMDEAFTRAFLP